MSQLSMCKCLVLNSYPIVFWQAWIIIIFKINISKYIQTAHKNIHFYYGF
jgi:hypothetical protein